MPTEKLTADRIRELFKQGYTVERIKREFGGSKDRIRKFRDIMGSYPEWTPPKIPEKESKECDQCSWQTEMDGYVGCGARECHFTQKPNKPTDRPTDQANIQLFDINNRPRPKIDMYIGPEDSETARKVLHSNRMNNDVRALLLRISQVWQQ